MFLINITDKTEVLQYENFDLDNVITPVNVEILNNLLTQSNYSEKKTKFLVDGFINGFSIGVEKEINEQRLAPNLKLRVGNESILWNKVMKEVKAKRYAGPFTKPPFNNFIQSPIGLVPKGEGGKDTRLIFHLSYPRDGTNNSVNAMTDKELCSVRYPDFSRAVELCMKAGVACSTAKSDMSSAFRHLGILKKHWPLLVMKARNPIDKQWYFFVDKCLPFGSSISCAHFQEFSNGIAHIVRFRTKQDLVNYLDDFFFAALLKLICDGQVETFLQVCKAVNFPVNLEKTFWGSTRIVFLGLLLDTVNQMILIPMEKNPESTGPY